MASSYEVRLPEEDDLPLTRIYLSLEIRIRKMRDGNRYLGNKALEEDLTSLKKLMKEMREELLKEGFLEDDEDGEDDPPLFQGFESGGG